MNITTYIGMQAYPKQFKHFDITDTKHKLSEGNSISY